MNMNSLWNIPDPEMAKGGRGADWEPGREGFREGMERNRPDSREQSDGWIGADKTTARILCSV
jgi:hypothetical protein